jgi:multidrug resistance protein, MATE family
VNHHFIIINEYLRINTETQHYADLFAKYSIGWLFTQTLYQIIESYFQSINVVKPALIINFIFLFVNIGLNYLFIYGFQGFKGYGYIGSPIATSVTRLLILIVYVIYSFPYMKYHQKFYPKDGKWDFAKIFHKDLLNGYLCKQVLPLSISANLEEWQLSVIGFFAAKLGEIQIATHNATLEIFFLLTSATWGLTTASSIRVGHYLGSKEPKKAKQVAKVMLCCCLLLGTLITTLFMLLKDELGKIFSDDPDVWHMTSQICFLCGLGYLLLCVFYTSMAILDGQARPGIVAICFLIGAWFVAVPCSYIFAFVLDQDLIGLWYGLVLGYAVVTILSGYFTYTSNWNELAIKAYNRSQSQKQNNSRMKEHL